MIDILTYRFERLRSIVEMRLQKIGKMEQEVIFFFEQGELEQIQDLMQQKESILKTNEQLHLFIEKWEKEETDTQVHI